MDDSDRWMSVVRAVENAADIHWNRRRSEIEKLEFDLDDWCLQEDLESSIRAKVPSADDIHQLSSGYRKIECMVQISKALMASASELLDEYSDHFEPIISKLSNGLASLPDELLALIFKYAASNDQDPSNYAFGLSLVSRRFRRIVVEDSSLWSTLGFRGFTVTEKLNTLVSRFGADSDLHVKIIWMQNADFSALREFVTTCLAYSHRWKTLTIACQQEGEYIDNTTIHCILLRLMKVPVHRLILPRLRELRLLGKRQNGPYDYRFALQSAMDFDSIPLCETPNLRDVHCEGYIPPPSFPFISFTSFTLSLTLLPPRIDHQVLDITTFLDVKESITELSFNLEIFKDHTINGVEEREGDALLVDTAVCPSVTSFRLNATKISTRDVVKVIRPIEDALEMPKLQNLILTLRSERGNSSGTNVTLQTALEAVLPSPERYPLLTSFSIDMRFLVDAALPETHSTSIEISLYKIPRVSYLCVTMRGQIVFTGPYATSRQVPVSLRELEFRSCCDFNAEGLRFAVLLLKNLFVWDVLERVTIRNCRLLDYDTALEVVGKERLCFWKKS